MAGEDESKEFDATQKKLDDARLKGDFPRSAELTSAAALAAITIVMIQFGPALLADLGGQFRRILAESAAPAPMQMLQGSGAFASMAQGLAPLFLAAPIGVLLAALATRGAAWSPSALGFKANRINPIAGLKQRLGPTGLIHFGVVFGKAIAITVIFTLMVKGALNRYLTLPLVMPELGVPALIADLKPYLIAGVAVAICFGAADYLIQILRFRARMRMSRTEMKDEMKDSEGDPHVKAQRRQKGRQLAEARSIQDVPKADVIIVNPEHYAVALKWSRAKGAAPIVVAKGVDEVAARIRAMAAEHGVPIHRDPPTARAIYATVPIGKEIRPEQYRAVAAAIRFAETMRKRMGKRSLR